MRRLTRARICRQFTSVLPVILATSGQPYPNTSRSMNRPLHRYEGLQQHQERHRQRVG
jgi:hypothetical protein